MNALLLEDDPVFASALTRAVAALGDAWRVHACQAVSEARALVADPHRDLHLAIIDMNLPDGSGLDVIAALRQARPDVPALVVSSVSSEQGVLAAIRRGARGYLHKSEPVRALTDGIAQVLQGHYPISPSLARYVFSQVGAERVPAGGEPVRLTPKETETLQCIAQGLSYNESAHRMGVSLSTVQSHIRSLYRKLEVRSQVQAVEKARGQGLL
ncbi:response regulator [Ramlibacter sp. MAHUQ-53]|uniref:response regulator n=1 Tax=unclassified Ramlibacter TaxID=2617605 RepID=UPI0036319671